MAATLMACASARHQPVVTRAPAPVTKPTGPGAAPEPTLTPLPPPTLVVSYPTSGGGIAHYALSRRDSAISTMPTGDQQIQLRNRTAWVTLTWVASDTLTRFTATIDSVMASEGILTSLQQDSALNTRWTAIRRPGHTLSGFTADRRSLVGDQVRDELAILFPALPPLGARAGEEWRDSTARSTMVTAFELTDTAHTTYMATPLGAGAPAPVELQVSAVRQRAGKGTTSQFDQSIELAATGVDSLVWELRADGMPKRAAGTRRSRMDLTFPAIGQQVDVEEYVQFDFVEME